MTPPSAPAPSGSRGASIPSPVLSPALSVPAEPAPPSVADTSMPDADLPHAGVAEALSEETLGPRGRCAPSRSTSHSQRHPSTDAPVVEPAADREPNPKRSRRGAHRRSRFPGILLADALGVSSRPDDSSEQRGPLDDGHRRADRVRDAVAVAPLDGGRREVRRGPQGGRRGRARGLAVCAAILARRCSTPAIATGGIQELERAMSGAEHAGKLDLASSIAEEVARIEPEVAKHQQKRVEYAFRTNDRGRLVEAYSGSRQRAARAASRSRRRARSTSAFSTSPPMSRAPACAISSITPSSGRLATSGFTPLASAAVRRSDAVPVPRRSGGAPVRPRVRLVHQPRRRLRESTTFRATRAWSSPRRSRPATSRPTSPTCSASSSGNRATTWRRRTTRATTTSRSRTRRWGSLDEAIAEFQKALASPTNRLPTYEALGQCFLEKEQFKLASSDSEPRPERACQRGPVGGYLVSARARRRSCRGRRTRRSPTINAYSSWTSSSGTSSIE